MSAGPVRDPVSRDAPGAREIGFSLPEQYNASRILFDNLAAGRGDRTAILSPAGDATWSALCDAACRFGNALRARGLNPGDRVLLLLDDTAVCPAALFGAIRAGFVPVLVNTLSTRDLVRFYLEDSGATVAVVESGLCALFDRETVAGTALGTVVVANGPVPDGLPVAAGAWPALLADAAPDLPEAPTKRDDMAFWMYSSGSTGRPKGIVHLQHDMAYTAESYARHILHLGPDDICYSPPKIFFAYGLGNSVSFPFLAGATTALNPGRPDPGAVFDCIARYRPTVLFGLPTLYNALIGDARAATADLDSIRLCLSAAEVLSADLSAAWAARFGQRIVEGLGSTEMLHIYLSNTQQEQRPGSAGRRVPGYEVRLVDGDGRAVDGEDTGVLQVRGDSSTPCYWNRPEQTAETMRGDWIHTGDRFRVDADGFHYFLGRSDDLIRVSGQWVWPLEIELCLADDPRVRECAVAGVKMADGRMTLKAFVVAAPDATPGDALTRALQDRIKQALLPHKYPRIVEYLDALPKTGTDKIDRRKLLAGDDGV